MPVTRWREPMARVRPMLAVATREADEVPLAHPDLVYEPKYDGVRALVAVEGGDVRIWARSGNEKTTQFPEVRAAFAQAAATLAAPLLVDGEIVALDAGGQPVGFEALQPRIHLGRARDAERRAAAAPVAFFAFDLLRDGDEDVRALPLVERRARLEARLAPVAGPVLRLGRSGRGDGRALLDEARAQGWEGLVVKAARSPYRSGARSEEWRKLKLLTRQEFVVGGWTDPRGSREALGALLLGVWDGGELRYVGHVGTGFDRRTLLDLQRRLKPLAADRCPFAAVPPANERPHWVRPELVVEASFICWTDAGLLRHPVFLGVREDVRAAGVRRESEPEPPPLAPELTGVIEQLDAIEGGRGSGRVRLPDGASVDVTNLGKPLWPRLGVTKGDLLRYYVRVAPVLLPVVRDRPLVMRRFPDGVDADAFYQHRAPEPAPAGVRAETLPDDDVPARLVGGDLATLLAMAQLASVSQDPWFSRVQSSYEMDEVALDLDPMPGVPFARVLDVARWVRDELERLRVPSYPKTSGATGLHVFVPLPPGTTYDAGRLFAQIVATVVARKHPKIATVERAVDARGATVYIDYLQNIRGKTLACAYSARASEYAGASTPLTWAEVDLGVDPRAFTIRTLPRRLRRVGDLWAPVRTSPRADLHAALDALGRAFAPSGRKAPL